MVKVVCAIGLISVCLSGCIGPNAIRHERVDFSEAIALTGRQQLLLNLVRVHNRQPPQFTDVSSIVNTSQVSESFGATLMLPQNVINSLNGEMHTGHDYSPTFTIGANDQPAITYSPLNGSALVNQIAQPFTVDTIAALIDSEWHVLPLLSLVADRISLAPAQDPKLIGILQELWEKRLISFVASKAISTGGSLDDTLTIYFLNDQLKSFSKPDQERLSTMWGVMVAAYENTAIAPEAIGIYAPPHSANILPHPPPDLPKQYSIELRTSPATQPTLLSPEQVPPIMRLRSGLGMLAAADDVEYVKFIPSSQFDKTWVIDPSHPDYVVPLPLKQSDEKTCKTDAKEIPATQSSLVGSNEVATDTVDRIAKADRYGETFVGARATVFRTTSVKFSLIGIAHGKDAPSSSYVSVRFGDEFYYIEKRDSVSQRNFELISQLLTMQAVASTAPPPTPTINVGGH